MGQKQAKDFLNRFNKIGVKQIFVGQKLTAKTWEIFKRQKKRGTSFVDCANVAVCKEMGINKIFSFDQIYRFFPHLIENFLDKRNTMCYVNEE